MPGAHAARMRAPGCALNVSLRLKASLERNQTKRADQFQVLSGLGCESFISVNMNNAAHKRLARDSRIACISRNRICGVCGRLDGFACVVAERVVFVDRSLR
jgi:hypothetical protein